MPNTTKPLSMSTLSATTQVPARSRIHRSAWRVAHACLVVALAFGGSVLVGQMPVHRGFKNAEQGIELFVYIDSAHSEIILPLTNDVFDWSPWFSASDFKNVTGNESFVAFGWGDREFFLQTPGWEDLDAGITSLAMLWPTSTVMHVTLQGKPTASESYRRVVIEPAAYEQMVRFVESHFVLDGSKSLGALSPRWIADEHYGNRDAFYEANGVYSILYTCNAWTSDALEVAGVRTGCWTPFPVGISQWEE